MTHWNCYRHLWWEEKDYHRYVLEHMDILEALPVGAARYQIYSREDYLTLLEEGKL